MSEVLWRKYHDYSGCLVRAAGPKIPLPIDGRHIATAIWLTSQLEAPSYGLVQSYDGAAMSAGLLHNVAVLPRSMEQGDFFALLRAMFDGGLALPLKVAIETAFAAGGWRLTADGKLRDKIGKLIPGDVIRDTFTPKDGVVPKTGPDWDAAARWALLFARVFSDPTGFTSQNTFAERWLARGNKTDEMEVYRKFTEDQALDSMIGLPAVALPEPVHFAMCVYHSFSVNAPAPARSCLLKAMNKTVPEKFARTLIEQLGTNSHGRWRDEPGEGGPNRYDRTRMVLNSEQGKQLFSEATLALMPRDL